MTRPLVSVVTPTWQRNRILFERCIPSVQDQDYDRVQHVVVSDGPDHELGRRLMTAQGRHPVVYGSVPEHVDEAARVRARNLGCVLAAGELITYNDSDDKLRPHHVSTLVAALEAHPECGFAYSQMASHNGSGGVATIGGEVPAYCAIGTPMIMHRRELLDIADWGPSRHDEDWQLVARWLAAGVDYVFVPVVTVDVWPSAYFGEERAAELEPLA